MSVSVTLSPSLSQTTIFFFQNDNDNDNLLNDFFFHKDNLLNDKVTTPHLVAAPTVHRPFVSSSRRLLHHFLVRLFFFQTRTGESINS